MRIVQLAALILLVAAVAAVAHTDGGEPEPVKHRGPQGTAHIHIQLVQGSVVESNAYYKKISAELGFREPQFILSTNLDDLLYYCGYTSDVLTAKQIQDLCSADLMKMLPNELLAAAYFSPKITDVSGDVPRAFGWRKVARLKPRAGSGATHKGIIALYVLSNHFQNAVADNPFANESVSTQVMLVRGPESALVDPAYWLVYEPLSKGGKLTSALQATFDTGNPAITTAQSYFVPRACSECHGGGHSTARLNYLDSDHWFDRVQPCDDFADLRAGKHGVLFDGGKVTFDGGNDPPGLQFKTAFETVYLLNKEILDQNQAVSPSGFATKAAATWLKVHTDRANKPIATYLPPIDRAIPVKTAGGKAYQWTKDNANDENLLKLLNRYCYRCHSSLRYNVYDKSAVRVLSSEMRERIARTPFVPQVSMPQDRTLEQAVKNKLFEALNKLETDPVP